MNRDDFTEGSVEQAIFDLWDNRIDDQQFSDALMKLPQKDLIDFILQLQDKGKFGSGYIHP